jgi:putative pantetheine hydrolase
VPSGGGNSLTDVSGLRVGHATLDGDGWLTGVTVVLAPPDGATCGVDVRGGGPGTRETDLLDPRNSVERVHAVVLGGGSAYGLSAAHGVLTRLAALGRGLPVGTAPSHVVPIVPAAILFDLGRGGVFGNYPGERAGEAAFDAALGASGAGPGARGNVGAGTGAVAGQLKGGLGTASTRVELPVPGQPARAFTVAALAAVNAVGSVADERTGQLYGAQFGAQEEFGWLRPPGPAELAAAAGLLAPRGGGAPSAGPGGAGEPRGALPPPLNTTIGVVACDASLTKAQCAKLAGVAHDGLARAVRPAHSMFDGDTIFALATGDGPVAAPPEFHALLSAAADCFARAVVHGVLAAASVRTPGGEWPAYLDLFPSAGFR